MHDLKGRTALVTGAGGGIGAAIARRFATAGAAVACLDLAPPETLAQAITQSGAKAIALAADVSDETAIQTAVDAAIARLGPIHILVNGASPDDPTGTILDLPPVQWAQIIAVHLTGAYLTSRAILPAMIEAGGGSIIHIASQMGRVGSPGRPAYCAAKGALIQLAKVMALDHAHQNIRVNALSPGAIETRRMLLRHGTMEAARQAVTPLHPIGRLGQPEDIAEAALFLASDASRFMTGADLLVDGGYTAI